MKKMFRAPEPFKFSEFDCSVFLAGSIEQGKAENWQEKVYADVSVPSGKKVVFANPRRKQWDSTWRQSIDNPNFTEQVIWELRHLQKADIPFFYFEPNTKSPITLHELGIVLAQNKRVIIVCPDGFWRKGNVEVSAAYFGWMNNEKCPIYQTMEEGIAALEKMIISRLR